MTQTIDFSAFGKNDIRGIYGKDVTEELFYYTGKGFVKYIEEKSGLSPKDIWITVSRDARLHSEILSKVLIKGIVHTGANVINLDVVPTPIGYYSEFASYPEDICSDVKISAALIVTASHNPPEYNGLKLTFNKSSLNEEEIKKVKNYTIEQMSNDITAVKHGESRLYNILPQYEDFMVSRFGRIGKDIKVVVDSANGTAGVIAPKLYRELGCEVIELYSEPDGNFPNHHPNPSDTSTLKDIKSKVIETGADLGIAFDGDSDRLGIIDSDGNTLAGDKLLYIYALDVIKELSVRGEHPVVVSEVKCSQVLFDEINKNGGRAIMSKTGHGYIKSKMKETDAILAGEMSGHMFFKDRYYGFDDAVYAGCRIIEIVAKNKKINENFKLSDLLLPFKKVCTLDEVRYKCKNELKKSVLREVQNRITNNADLFDSSINDIVTLDGLRIIFPDGFALIRQSNTEPVFTLRFEARTKKNALKYKKVMINLLDDCISKVSKSEEK
ncbi:MAG: phosphomannomutase/phosphoglucomutase [Candidatus Gastranaerophilales bacterium]|nr:phosphomannomutase/phosphoglucomutase [Candidatus Gastranaerophilales bacterium]